MITVFLIGYDFFKEKWFAKVIYHATVETVFDGNSVKLSTGDIVTLAGVYIPKRGEVNYRESLSDNIRQLLQNKEVRIELIQEKTFNYPVYDLVKIYSDDFSESINEKLLKEGMAFFDHGYYSGKEIFHKLQKEAEKTGTGIWKNKSELTPLYIGAESWKFYYYPNSPKVAEILKDEKIIFYFDPPSMFFHRHLAIEDIEQK